MACSPESDHSGTVDDETQSASSSDQTGTPTELTSSANGAATSTSVGSDTSDGVTSVLETGTNPIDPIGSSNGGSSSTPAPSCTTPQPGPSPLRRLTRFEFSNSLEALLNDSSDAGQHLPAELLGNGFGNDADAQPSSAFLIEQYANVAQSVVASAPLEALTKYDACIGEAAPTEESCARNVLGKFAQAAYRRPLLNEELDDVMALQQTLRQYGDFKSSITGAIEAVLQSPDFLYRLEFGEVSSDGLRRPTGPEMATRLSYFLWGGPPDSALQDAALRGELSTAPGVLIEAERMLNDPKSRRVVQFFFDNLLPVTGLTDQTRDPTLFPSFSPRIGALMAEETTRFLEHAIFEGEGTWDAILTAPHTFVNEELAGFYGMQGVSGEDFRKVDVDTTKRLGLLTHASILTGTTVTNYTNPVRRGGFLLSHILCIDVPLPPEELAALVKPPEPYSGKTGRERYTAHSSQEACRTCHSLLDPPGFALENFDAVGLWRDQENEVTIDASGDLAGIGSFGGPVDLVQAISDNEATHRCFAHQWQKFAYGRKVSKSGADECTSEWLGQAFTHSGHNVKQLLLDITQTDGFLYLEEQQQ